LYGNTQEFNRTLGMEFRGHALFIGADGLGAQTQAFRNLLVFQAIGYKLKDL
jgi:hypothetical protein